MKANRKLLKYRESIYVGEIKGWKQHGHDETGSQSSLLPGGSLVFGSFRLLKYALYCARSSVAASHFTERTHPHGQAWKECVETSGSPRTWMNG